MSTPRASIPRVIALTVTLAVVVVSAIGCSAAEVERPGREAVRSTGRFPGASGLLAHESFVSETSVPATGSLTEAVDRILSEVPSGHGDLSAKGSIRGVVALLPVLGADAATGVASSGRMALLRTGDYLVVVRLKDGKFGMFVIAQAPGSSVWSFVGVPGDPSLVMRAVAPSSATGGSFVPVVTDDGRDTYWVLTGTEPESDAVPVEFPPEAQCRAGGAALHLGQAYPSRVLFGDITCKQ